MRKGEPESSTGLATRHSKGERQRPGAATRCLQPAHCRPTTRSHFSRFHLRRSGTPVQSRRQDTECRTHSRSIAEAPGRRLMGTRLWGLEKICARQARLQRQTAAHGQITERKLSVSQSSLFPRLALPIPPAPASAAEPQASVPWFQDRQTARPRIAPPS